MTAQKMKFSIKNFFSKCDQIIFTKEILNGKFHFLCSECKRGSKQSLRLRLRLTF